LKTGYYTIAFLLVALHDYMDHLDGIVATVQRNMGYKDDPKLGSFLDAFCDKMVNITCIWSFVLLCDFAQMNFFQICIFLWVCCTVIAYEVILAVVRVQDFYATVNAGEQRNLSANMEGKLKEKMESLGLALFCLGMPNIVNTKVGIIGLFCFVCSICLAQSSLSHKLEGRKSKELSPNSHKKQLETNLTVDATKDRYDKVYTIGCFDLVHRGHRNLFRTMRSIGDQIVVGVHSDESIFKLKNKWPVDPLAKRMQNVKKYADIVFAIPDTDPTPYILSAITEDKNSVFVRGDDMPNFPSRSSVEQLMDVRLIPYTDGISSTALRNKLLQGEITHEQISSQ